MRKSEKSTALKKAEIAVKKLKVRLKKAEAKVKKELTNAKKLKNKVEKTMQKVRSSTKKRLPLLLKTGAKRKSPRKILKTRQKPGRPSKVEIM